MRATCCQGLPPVDDDENEVTMSERCPRCQPLGASMQRDTDALCAAHARQVLDEIVDEAVSSMKARQPGADNGTAFD